MGMRRYHPTLTKASTPRVLAQTSHACQEKVAMGCLLMSSSSSTRKLSLVDPLGNDRLMRATPVPRFITKKMHTPRHSPNDTRYGAPSRTIHLGKGMVRRRIDRAKTGARPFLMARSVDGGAIRCIKNKATPERPYGKINMYTTRKSGRVLEETFVGEAWVIKPLLRGIFDRRITRLKPTRGFVQFKNRGGDRQDKGHQAQKRLKPAG